MEMANGGKLLRRELTLPLYSHMLTNSLWTTETTKSIWLNKNFKKYQEKESLRTRWINSMPWSARSLPCNKRMLSMSCIRRMITHSSWFNLEQLLITVELSKKSKKRRLSQCLHRFRCKTLPNKLLPPLMISTSRFSRLPRSVHRRRIIRSTYCLRTASISKKTHRSTTFQTQMEPSFKKWKCRTPQNLSFKTSNFSLPKTWSIW